MNVVRCPSCGGRMKRNGKTGADRTRWRCKVCGASLVDRIDNSAKRLGEFLGWLLSKERQADMPGGGRTFRRRTQEFWRVWPLPPVTGEVCRVVFVDGIFLTHERLVKARNSLTALVRSGTPFTYVDPGLTEMLGALPATNNAVESANAQLRAMLSEHRGLSLERRIKAVYWW